MCLVLLAHLAPASHGVLEMNKNYPLSHSIDGLLCQVSIYKTQNRWSRDPIITVLVVHLCPFAGLHDRIRDVTYLSAINRGCKTALWIWHVLMRCTVSIEVFLTVSHCFYSGKMMFKTHYKVWLHVHVHSGQKAHSCRHCSDRFYRRSAYSGMYRLRIVYSS